jgi:hypothetical protein
MGSIMRQLPARRTASRRLALALAPLAVLGGVGAAPAEADTAWPSGLWSACASETDQYCVQEATITPLGGDVTALAEAGLSSWVSTLEGYVTSFNWAVNGWDDPAVAPEVRAGDVRLVVRTGQFMPRYTMAIASGLRISRQTDGAGDTTLTITGRPVQMNWTTGDLFGSCVAGWDCGDDNTQADAVGTRLNFSGNTQDLGTWDDSSKVALDGMYIASNAQARPTTLLIGTYPELFWYMPMLGNPHLTADGLPARGSFNAWLPDSFFTSAGTTASAAAATGFSVTAGNPGSGPGAAGVEVPAVVGEHDGGVAIEVADMPFSVHAVTVANRTPTVTAGTATAAAPGAVTLAPAAGQVGVSWTAPGADGGSPVTGYTARAFTAAQGGTIAASCTSASTACRLTGLAAGTQYWIAVSATNGLGEGRPSTRLVTTTPTVTVPGAPTQLAVAAGPGRLTATWSAPGSNGGSPITGYTARAHAGSAAGPVRASCTATTTTCTLSGLAAGTGYVVTVRASNALGAGPAATAALVKTPTGPGRPAKITVAAAPGRLVAAWTAPSTDGGSPVTGYVARAYNGATGGAAVATCNVAATARRCELKGLVDGRRYYVDVLARNGVGLGPVTARLAGTPVAAPDAPRSVSVRSSGRRVTVAWQPPSSAHGSAVTGYVVRLFGARTGGTPALTCKVPGTARSCTTARLKAGQVLWADVVAVNAVGSSAPSGPRIKITVHV